MRLTALLLALGLMLGCGPDRIDRLEAKISLLTKLHTQVEADYYQSYDELLKLDNPQVNEILFKHMASVGKLEDQIKQEAAK